VTPNATPGSSPRPAPDARPWPGWWEPLRTRVAATSISDFTRLPLPVVGGRPSAVLILLADEGGTPDVLVLERAADLRNHAGQPAFPGGAAEPGDRDAVATALREAHEEVGVDPATVSVVSELPRLWIPVSDFVVTPVLAWWHDPHPVHPKDAVEVARVARLPVGDLADPACRLRVRHSSGYVGPAFDIGGMLVWGFTAGVLAKLLELGGWARPWDEQRVRELPEASTRPVP
jgi:8-oxo-dGTP pyrophosphatase MutT (NUDIX family)